MNKTFSTEMCTCIFDSVSWTSCHHLIAVLYYYIRIWVCITIDVSVKPCLRLTQSICDEIPHDARLKCDRYRLLMAVVNLKKNLYSTLFVVLFDIAKYSCSERPPVLNDHFLVALRAVSCYSFHCIWNQVLFLPVCVLVIIQSNFVLFVSCFCGA